MFRIIKDYKEHCENEGSLLAMKQPSKSLVIFLMALGQNLSKPRILDHIRIDKDKAKKHAQEQIDAYITGTHKMLNFIFYRIKL